MSKLVEAVVHLALLVVAFLVAGLMYGAVAASPMLLTWEWGRWAVGLAALVWAGWSYHRA